MAEFGVAALTFVIRLSLTSLRMSTGFGKLMCLTHYLMRSRPLVSVLSHSQTVVYLMRLFGEPTEAPVSVSNVCAICKSYGESVEHLMRDCNFVQQLLERLGLPVASNPVADPWINWIASYFVSLSGREQRVLLVLYWAVWFARNKMVHEGMLNSVDDVVAFVAAFFAGTGHSNQVLPAPTQVCEASWQAPPESVIKVNFDSSYSSRNASATSGIIARNSQGLIMETCSFPHMNVADAFVAEAYACKQAVGFAKDLGFTKVIIEGDSPTIIKKLNSRKVDRSVVYPVIRDIQALFQDFVSISFCFVRREANVAAHVLAQECRSFSTPHCWMEEAPVATTAAAESDRRKLLQNHDR
ncbi:hypothetical protein V6N11_060777 [Hibiscus sabdariffa]